MKKVFIITLFIINLFCLFPTDLKIALWDIKGIKDEGKIINKIDTDLLFITNNGNENLNKYNFQYYYSLYNDKLKFTGFNLLSQKEVTYNCNKDRIVPFKENKNYHFEYDAVVVKTKINYKSIFIIYYKTDYNDNHEDEYKKKVAEVKALLDIISDIYSVENNPYIILLGDFNTKRQSEMLNILEKSGLIILNYFFNKNDIYTAIINQEKVESYFIMINKPLFDNCKIKRFKNIKEKNIDKYPLIFNLYIK